MAAFEEVKDPLYQQWVVAIRETPHKFRDWRVENEMIYRRREEPLLGPIVDEAEAWKLVVPQEYREKVLCDAHQETSSGHLGVEKTYERIARIIGRGCGMRFTIS